MEKKLFKDSLIDIVVNLCIYAVLAAFFAQLMATPKAVAGYPKFLLLGAVLFNTVVLIQGVKRFRKEEAAVEAAGFGASFARILLYIAIIGAYIFFISRLGFVVSTVAFVLGMLLLIGIRSWKQLVMLPLLLTGSIYFLFNNILTVLLPKGTWLSQLF